MDIENTVRFLLAETENAIKTICTENGNNYGIIFPPYSSLENKQRKIRRSEQELRCIFIEQFLKYRNSRTDKYDLINWHYSIETPTKAKYTSACKGNPSIDGSRSGKIDLTLYENNNPVVFIEFKYGSLGKANKNLEYDVIKLVAESSLAGGNCRGFSVNLIKQGGNALTRSEFNTYIEDAINNITGKYQNLSRLNPKEIKMLSHLNVDDLKKRISYKCIKLPDNP